MLCLTHKVLKIKIIRKIIPRVSIQQALETVKVAREVQRQAIPQPSISRQTEKQPKIQPHFLADVLNLSAPIRAGPLLI